MSAATAAAAAAVVVVVAAAGAAAGAAAAAGAGADCARVSSSADSLLEQHAVLACAKLVLGLNWLARVPRPSPPPLLPTRCPSGPSLVASDSN